MESTIEFREVDTVMVQGKDEPTTIYSVEKLINYPQDYINNYNKGIKMFKLGNWNFALSYFNICKSLYKVDEITDIYINRCEDFLIEPPDNWSGAITLNFK